ncbi:hypothetical protein OUZ56_000741 [Daphnia magna]|uniref:Uncharacterized protein n=1 Tax=Daphnia magna TaxID=35525 RepID=A0ABR0A0L4_9CRUS|nr:hypothetical protein OUZ56_000741 [Daphnia magna]
MKGKNTGMTALHTISVNRRHTKLVNIVSLSVSSLRSCWMIKGTGFLNIGRWPKGKPRLANFGLMDQVAENCVLY